MLKLYLRWLTVILYCHLVMGSYAQKASLGHLDSLIVNYVKDLHNIQKVDSFCIYSSYTLMPAHWIKWSPDNYCNTDIFIPRHILWLKNGKTFLTEKDNCFDYTTINYNADTLWNYFLRNKNIIKREKVKTFQYLDKKDTVNSMVDHSDHQDFKIMIGADTIEKWFDSHDLQEKETFGYAEDTIININYRYNNSLKSKYFADMMEKVVRNVEGNKLLIGTRRQ